LKKLLRPILRVFYKKHGEEESGKKHGV